MNTINDPLLKRPISEESLCDVTLLPKQPLKKLEFALKRIAKVVSLHLEFLQRHKCNIVKFEQHEEWNKLNEERINASRTVQQLKADMYELEIIGQQIVIEDLPRFEEQANVIKNDILKEIGAFLAEYQETMQPGTAIRSLSLTQHNQEVGSESQQSQRSPTPPCVAFPFSPETEELFTRSSSVPNTMDNIQMQQSIKKDSSTYRSWDALNKELLDLNGLIKRFAETVKLQKEFVDRIDTNVETVHENVAEGTGFLKKAAKYKLALLPLSGAMVGGFVGGPLGLLAGYKTGAALAVGGGIIGFCSGRFVQKKQYSALNNNNIELEEISASKRKLKNSLSLNDLST